ncbi:MAG: TIGR02186 family protein [Alphaproteobacteria bacterium]|nr:TIGR02186 family protein [Alphaproteobacteria bacterium]
MKRIFIFLFFMLSIPFSVHADPNALVADLSHHLIAIHTDFKGTDVVLFGSVDEGGHIVVTVKGPRKNFVVQRKEKTMGVWLNRTGIKYHNMPSFFRIASDVPLDEILTPNMITRYEFTPETLDIESSKDFFSNKYRFYKEELIEKLRTNNFYGRDIERIKFLGPHLFRTILHFPSNVPPGIYTVHVYLIKDNQVIAAQSTPLSVNKVGLSADLFAFAHNNSFIYGITAILCALMLGAVGGIVLRRGRHAT